MPAKKKVSAVFVQDKVTKNTVRFKAESDNAFTAYVYVMKDAAEKLGNVERVTVTVEAR
jgi:hypothetical protein